MHTVYIILFLKGHYMGSIPNDKSCFLHEGKCKSAAKESNFIRCDFSKYLILVEYVSICCEMFYHIDYLFLSILHIYI